MTDFGDRMKLYEKIETGRKFMPGLPIMARVDGKCFHSFCKHLKRPYDKRMSDLMVKVTEYLVAETGAKVGYTQSDEISLMWYAEDHKTQMFFGGKIFKMTSVIAAMTTAIFNKLLPDYLPEKEHMLPVFDCRVWQVPNLTEAANVFVWREQDAVRNSVQMAAQSMFSHKMLQGKNASHLHDMMWMRGVNWNDYPAFFKRGSYVKRIRKFTKFSVAENKRLPDNHQAKNLPNFVVERNVIEVIKMPELTKINEKVQELFY